MTKALLFISIINNSPNSESELFKLDSVYYHYTPVLIESVYQGTLYQPEFSDTQEDGNLKLSGFKNFSYDINQGFDQGLKIDITGEVRGVRIEGNLSDKSIPLSTVPLSDIEQMSLNIFTPNVSAGLGNLTRKLPFGLEDEIQGGLLNIHTRQKEKKIGLSYAINRGDFKIKRFNGEEGKQSPYFLEEGILANSEKVFLSQGISRPILLRPGEDYTIDYAQGILSFTNNYIVTKNSRIEVEYRKTNQDYPKIYQEADFKTGIEWLQGLGLYRRLEDDRMNPLAFELSPAEIESLKIVGDSSVIVHTYADSSDSGSYNLEQDHFVYVGEGKGDYNVTFFYVGENNGEYTYDPLTKGFVYQGENLGNYTPKKYLPLPGSDEFYGAGIELFNGLKINLYGSGLDKNTFSDLDDEDNKGAGIETEIKKEFGLLSINGELLHYEDNFHKPQRKEEIDYKAIWNTSEPIKEKGIIRLGIEPFEFLKFGVGYGILNRKHKRRLFSIEPFFFHFYYEDVDTLQKYGVLLRQEIGPVGLYGNYGHLSRTQFINYNLTYSFNKDYGIGLNGNIERDTTRTGITTSFNLKTTFLKLLLGQRKYADTTYYFGNCNFNLQYKNFNIYGSMNQSQRYSQKRDEAFIRVGKGKGNYTYDPLTGSYIEKDGGEYVKKIILLPQFDRVITKNYAVEPAYSFDQLDITARFNYLDQKLFQKILGEMTISLSDDIYDIELNLYQENSNDARYALSSIENDERHIEFSPSYKRFMGSASYLRNSEKYGARIKEERTVYESALGYNLIEKPLIRPRPGYRQSRLLSDFFNNIPLYQYAPYIDFLIEIPIKKEQGRLSFDTELLYRIYSQKDVPYFYTASEPAGFTKSLKVTFNLGLGNNTAINVVYTAILPSREGLNQNLRFQTMIKF